jgi:hypothetical protein
MISTRSSSAYSMTTIRANRAYGEVYVTYSFIEISAPAFTVMSALPQKRTLVVGVPRTPRATSELSNLLFARAYWGTILFRGKSLSG